MRFCYADPPYIGLAHYYPENREVDHAELIGNLCRDFPDGWALSLHTPALRQILGLCPDDVRVGAWVKPFCSFKPNIKVAYAWEPVIFRGGRKRDREEATVRDWIAESITLQRGMVGAKPDKFCFWIFDLLGMNLEDEFVDLYPGSGAVMRAWHAYRFNLRCQMEEGQNLELAL